MSDLEPAESAQTLTLIDARPLDRNPAAVYLGALRSKTSQRTMRSALNIAAALMAGARIEVGGEDVTCLHFAWERMRYQHVQRLVSLLLETVSEQTGEPYSPNTVNKFLSAVKGVLRECWRLGLVSAEDYQRAVDVKTIKVEKALKGRALSEGEIRRLFETFAEDDTAAGVRDAALFSAFFPGGLRRAEAVDLDVGDFVHVEPGLAELRVRSGKRRKDRAVPLHGGAVDALLDWLDVRGDAPGALFLPVNKGGRVIYAQNGAPARLTAGATLFMCQRWAARAGLEPFTPHDLRRTTITAYLDAGAGDITVAGIAGHASTDTTRRYDMEGERRKRKAAGLLHIPYRRRCQ